MLWQLFTCSKVGAITLSESSLKLHDHRGSYWRGAGLFAGVRRNGEQTKHQIIDTQNSNGTFASPRLFIANHLKTRITATSKRSLSIEAKQRKGTDISLLNAFIFR